jgi:hypothetical protein
VLVDGQGNGAGAGLDADVMAFLDQGGFHAGGEIKIVDGFFGSTGGRDNGLANVFLDCGGNFGRWSLVGRKDDIVKGGVPWVLGVEKHLRPCSAVLVFAADDFECLQFGHLVFTDGSRNPCLHVRDQANPQHVADVARDELAGKAGDDKAVLGEASGQGHPQVRQRPLPLMGEFVEDRGFRSKTPARSCFLEYWQIRLASATTSLSATRP